MGDPLLLQQRPLARASGRDYVGTNGLRNLHSGLAHPPSGGVNQYAFAWLQFGEFHQPIPGGQESQRQGGRVIVTEVVGDGYQLWGGQSKVAGKGPCAGSQAHDAITHHKLSDTGTDRSDDTGTFKAQAYILRLIDAQHSGVIFLQQPKCIQYIAQVHAHGLDGHFDFAGTWSAARQRHKAQVIQRAIRLQLEAYRLGGIDDRRRLPRCHLGDITGSLVIGDLRCPLLTAECGDHFLVDTFGQQMGRCHVAKGAINIQTDSLPLGLF